MQLATKRSLLLNFLLMICISSGAGAAAGRNHRQITHAALVASASRARDVSAYISDLMSRGKSERSREAAGAYADCAFKLADGASRLERSVREINLMGRAGSRGFALHKSNMMTWVSAALTDQTTCLDGLRQGGVGVAVQKRVDDAGRLTSWVLALVNRIHVSAK